MSIGTKRAIFGALALLFIALVLLLLRAGFKLTFDDRDYWIGFLGFCFLLEVSYVAAHFSLKTIFFARPDVVTRATRVMAAIVALPVTIMFVLLLVIVGGAMIGTGTETLEYLVDLALILALLGLPAFFLWRHVLRGLKRAEQIVGPKRGERVSQLDSSGDA